MIPSCVRLNILSDLHISLAGQPLPGAASDIVILAGDISRPRQAIDWASGIERPVIYVPGNHEFYGGSLDSTNRDLDALSRGSSIHVLNQQEIVLHGIRFLGATLWTDFMLYGEGPQRQRAIEQAIELIRDFSRIQSDDRPGSPFTPLESARVFRRHSAWLADKLSEPFDGPTVVVTHHGPSPRSIHPRFAGSPLNTCFVSNVEHLMDGDRVPLWIHGHTHDSFDYTVNGTRVVCNPRGYARDGVNENALFDPDFIVDVPTRAGQGLSR